MVTPAQLKAWRKWHQGKLDMESRQKKIDEMYERARMTKHDLAVARWRAGVAVVDANNLHGAGQIQQSYPGYWPF